MASLDLALLEQGSEAWLKARVGKITASRMKDVLDFTAKKEEGAKRKNYRMELVAERLTNLSEEDVYVSKEMQWGILNEPFARAEYEIITGEEVDRVGFIDHPEIPWSGASPDGCIGKVGMLELKCPKTTTHLKWRMAGVLPEEHKPQMLFQLACRPERQYNDFMSYDPRLPKHLQYFIVRLERPKSMIAEIEDKVIAFNNSVQAIVDELLAL